MRNTEVWSGIIVGAVALFFYARQTRDWKTLHPYRRLGIAVGMVTVVLAAVVSTLNIPWVGRYVLGAIIAGFLSYGILYALSVKRHEEALSSFACAVGMRAIHNPKEESSDPDLFNIKKWLDKDIYKWKVGGTYPALVKKEGDWVYVVRVAKALDFDYDAPVATCFAAVKKTPFNTLTLVERRRASRQPKKIFSTGDDSFDSRFFLSGAQSSDAETLFTPPVREFFSGMKDFPGTLRVERYGVYYYLPGRVQTHEEVQEGLRIMTQVCRWVDESTKT